MNIIQIDNDLSSETSSLTTALSGQTPTDPFGDDPTIQALLQAASNADYELVVATIPLHHKLTIKRIQYILFEPYSTRRSKKVAWYWVDHGVELIRATLGTPHISLRF